MVSLLNESISKDPQGVSESIRGAGNALAARAYSGDKQVLRHILKL